MLVLVFGGDDTVRVEVCGCWYWCVGGGGACVMGLWVCTGWFCLVSGC